MKLEQFSKKKSSSAVTVACPVGRVAAWALFLTGFQLSAFSPAQAQGGSEITAGQKREIQRRLPLRRAQLETAFESKYGDLSVEEVSALSEMGVESEQVASLELTPEQVESIRQDDRLSRLKNWFVYRWTVQARIVPAGAAVEYSKSSSLDGDGLPQDSILEKARKSLGRKWADLSNLLQSFLPWGQESHGERSVAQSSSESSGASSGKKKPSASGSKSETSAKKSGPSTAQKVAKYLKENREQLKSNAQEIAGLVNQIQSQSNTSTFVDVLAYPSSAAVEEIMFPDQQVVEVTLEYRHQDSWWADATMRLNFLMNYNGRYRKNYEDENVEPPMDQFLHLIGSSGSVSLGSCVTFDAMMNVSAPTNVSKNKDTVLAQVSLDVVGTVKPITASVFGFTIPCPWVDSIQSASALLLAKGDGTFSYPDYSGGDVRASGVIQDKGKRKVLTPQ